MMQEKKTLIDEIRGMKPGTKMCTYVDIPEDIILEKNYFSIASDMIRHNMTQIRIQNCHIYKIEQVKVPMDCRVRGIDTRFKLFFIKMGEPEKVGFKTNPAYWGFT